MHYAELQDDKENVLWHGRFENSGNGLKTILQKDEDLKYLAICKLSYLRVRRNYLVHDLHNQRDMLLGHIPILVFRI